MLLIFIFLSIPVIPAKAGIQECCCLDSRLHGNDKIKNLPFYILNIG